jgi:hypothetical protein
MASIQIVDRSYSFCSTGMKWINMERTYQCTVLHVRYTIIPALPADQRQPTQPRTLLLSEQVYGCLWHLPHKRMHNEPRESCTARWISRLSHGRVPKPKFVLGYMRLPFCTPITLKHMFCGHHFQESFVVLLVH